MTGEAALERRYRRLLAWYPPEHRRAYGEEMIGVLLAAASGGSGRPGLAGSFDLIRCGLRARLLAGWRKVTGAGWPDALALCSVAVPIILLATSLRSGRISCTSIPARRTYKWDAA